MSAPGPSQVYRFSDVRDSGVFITVSVRGAAGPAFEKRLMDQLQGVIGSQMLPGTYPPERAEDAVDRGYILSNYEAEHTTRQPPTGQHPPSTHKDDPQPPEGQSTHGPLDVDMTTPSPETYRDVGPSDPATHPPEAIIANLESQVAELATKNDELNESVKKTTDEKDELVSRLHKAILERDELVRQRQVNILKIRKLNDMIIKNSQKSDEPLDDEMLQDTFKIRNMATEVIKTHFPGEAKYRVEPAKRLDEYYRHFYEQRVRFNLPEGRRRLLISLIFGELQLWFFGPSAKRFGVPNEIEKQLQQFEKQIEQSNKVETEESLEWRTRTVSYAVRLNHNCLDIVNHVTRHITNLLIPMTRVDKHGSQDKKQLADIENALFELCSAALKLSLRFRSSKTKYEFKAYQNDTCQAACEEELIKPLDTEGPISKPVDQNRRFIFCTLWGALVKTRPPVSGEAGDRVVLEKGQVILYEPDLWSKSRDAHGTA